MITIMIYKKIILPVPVISRRQTGSPQGHPASISMLFPHPEVSLSIFLSPNSDGFMVFSDFKTRDAFIFLKHRKAQRLKITIISP